MTYELDSYTIKSKLVERRKYDKFTVELRARHHNTTQMAKKLESNCYNNWENNLGNKERCRQELKFKCQDGRYSHFRRLVIF